MSIIESIFTGFRELWSHKMQSLLTMLGVIFGVAAVISMVSIGEGAKFEAMEQIRRMGTNLVIIKRLSLTGEARQKAEEKSPFGLYYGDSLYLEGSPRI